MMMMVLSCGEVDVGEDNAIQHQGNTQATALRHAFESIRAVHNTFVI